MVNGEKEESVGETPTGATETVALAGKSLMIGGAAKMEKSACASVDNVP